MSTSIRELALWLQAIRNGRDSSGTQRRFSEFIGSKREQDEPIRKYLRNNGIKTLADFEEGLQTTHLNEQSDPYPLDATSREKWDFFIHSVYEESPMLVAHLWGSRLDENLLHFKGGEWPSIESAGSNVGVTGGVIAQAQQRLERSTSTYLFLRFATKGFTTPHSHPGQELLFVLDGTATLNLSNGTKIVLAAKDLAHFNSEVEHWVTTEAACTLFVVRYYHLEGGILNAIRRTQQEDSYRVSLHGKATKRSSRLDNESLKPKHQRHIQAWIRQTEGPKLRPRSPTIPQEFSDPVGLSRLVDQCLRMRTPPLNRKVLASVFSDEGSPTTVSRFLNGFEIPPSKKAPQYLIESLVKTFSGFGLAIPRTLFLPYLAPRSPNCVVLSGETLPDGPFEADSVSSFDNRGAPRPVGWTKWSTFAQMIRDHKIRVGYYPEVMLADSDLSMSFVRLAPGAKCQRNQHPGFELVLPISGTVVVEYDIGSGQRTLTEVMSANSPNVAPAFAVYDSARLHSLSNPSKVTSSDVLLIRFFELWKGLK